MWHRIAHIGLACIAAWLLTVTSAALPRSPAPDRERPPHLPALSPLAERLASSLYRVYRLHESGQPDVARAQAAVLAMGDLGGDHLVRVVVHLHDGQARTQTAVSAAGLTVEATAAGGRAVQGIVPISQLEALALASGVRLVRPPLEPVVSGFVSEGVRMTGAETWHGQGWRGAGRSVAVLDLGFQGYAALLGGELPADTVAHSLRANGDIEAGTAHGTACAEIVHDMAPDARLHLVNLSTDIEFAAAVEYVRAQGVDVVSSSLGWPIGGAGDGSGPISWMMRGALDDGVLWVNAAGNLARRHWMGPWRDADGDGLLDWSAGAATNTVQVAPGQAVRLALRWEDRWGAAAHDFVLELYDNDLSLIDYSATPATGPGDPTRFIGVGGLEVGRYHVMVRRLDGAPGDPVIELFAYDQDLGLAVSEGSVLVPGDMADVIAVGAVRSDMPIVAEAFSGQGPARDGRLKPDLVAPDRISCASYGAYSPPAGGLWGTSAAGAHVAGAAAVLWAFSEGYNNVQMADLLRASTVDLGPEGPDTIFGHGRLLLDGVPAVQPTAAPSWTPSVTPAATETLTPSVTSTVTQTPILSPTPTASNTPTATATFTATPAPTETGAPTMTLTPTPGSSPTVTVTPLPIVEPGMWVPLVLRDMAAPTATPTPTVIACAQMIANGDFEDDGGWIRSVTAHRADYATAVVRSGERSMRLGIEPPDENRWAWSSIYQTIEVPADATSATLSVWWLRRTEEPVAGAAMLPPMPRDGGRMRLAALGYGEDLHEVLLLDAADPGTVVAILARGRANDVGWQPVIHDLSPWRGQRLLLYINAYNDGAGGRTWMHVDDVSLQVCAPQ